MAVAESSNLRGLRLLVVEDEAFISLMIEDLVTSFGCVLAGTASTVDEALKLIETVRIDGALIDLNLGGEMGAPVGQALFDRGHPPGTRDRLRRATAPRISGSAQTA